MHQYRSAYNLWDTPFDDLSTYPDGAQVREWIRQADNRLIPQAKKVFANSRTVADRLRRYNKIESQPLYHPPPRAESLRSGQQGDYVFYPSRLEPQKRQELLIEAMKFVTTPVKIVLAGGSGDPKRYESLVKKCNVGDRVCLRGFVPESEVIDLYRNALGVCYLPFDEDYGYVTLEGMLSGKPVIVARDGGGATEFIEHERDGLIVEPEPRAIAECLDSLYADRARARSLGERGQEKLKAMNLSWENVVESLINGAG
jgi:glycosyltransferase involved in cell wall biosynthesis